MNTMKTIELSVVTDLSREQNTGVYDMIAKECGVRLEYTGIQTVQEDDTVNETVIVSGDKEAVEMFMDELKNLYE